MHPLHIDPPLTFALSDDRPLQITVVGVGGTGGYVVQGLARLLTHYRRGDVTVTVIDGDTVEAKNVGRQLFAPADVGRNKAIALTTRFNAAFGLQMVAVPAMIDTSTSSFYRAVPSGLVANIVVGCVDNAAARRAIMTILQSRAACLWIDSGNHEWGGQVLTGTTTAMERRITPGIPIIAHLPAPSLLEPSLLDDPVVAVEPADCATALVDNRQAMMVNQMMATIVCHQLDCLLRTRQLTTYETTVDLQSLSMRSTPITLNNLARSLQCDPRELLIFHRRKDHDND